MTTHQQQPLQPTAAQAQKAPPAIDWLSFPDPAVVEAPHPDLFDFELDSLSVNDQQQIQLLTLDYQADTFQFFRSETPQQGPPSVITASSESAYETLSQHSESLYNYSNPSPSQYGVETYNNTAADLGIDLAGFSFQTPDITLAGMPSIASLLDRRDSTSNYSFNGYDARSNYSAGAAYVSGPGIAPHHTASAQRAGSAGDSPKSSDDHSHNGGDSDPRKKYACPNCTRSFARAYNLKTHMATHDPQRLKPYVCPHRSCGRSFSRKHDLGRHLVSIHRDETGSQYSVASGHSTASQRSESVAGIGMSADNAVRSWCDSCGRGFLGPQRACSCKDVK